MREEGWTHAALLELVTGECEAIDTAIGPRMHPEINFEHANEAIGYRLGLEHVRFASRALRMTRKPIVLFRQDGYPPAQKVELATDVGTLRVMEDDEYIYVLSASL